MRLVEQLENRRLYSTVTLVNGVLTITGTEAADHIVLSSTANGKINVSENGFQTPLGQFANTAVTKIVVNGLGGDDNLQNNVNVAIPSSMSGGDGNDTIIGMEGKDTINGNAGHDYITGNNNDDSLIGGEGNDTIRGGWGNDLIYGQGGDDVFTTDQTAGSDGNDLLHGGGGVDLADYAPRQGNLILSIDNFGNDGNIAANEKDNIQSDIENVRGGQGNDVISGSSADNKLEGQGGHDTIYGGAGNDTLLGNSGNDWLFGQDGADSIDGGANDDWVTGGADVDVLLGGAGSNIFIQ